MRLKDEQYKDFNISMEKERNEPWYNTSITDTRLGKVTGFKAAGNSKEQALKSIKVELDRLLPEGKSWETRKAYLEQTYGISKLTLESSRHSANFIYFYKGLHWEVTIKHAGETVIEYEEYPYSAAKNIDYDERGRSKGYYRYSFKADLERQIKEALRRIQAFKDIKKEIGTFGVNPLELDVGIKKGERNEAYKGFNIKIMYMYNEKEQEISLTTYVYKGDKLVTTDAYRNGYVRPTNIDEEIKRQFDKAKDWIARNVIYNMTGKVGETDMNKPVHDFEETRSYEYNSFYGKKGREGVYKKGYDNYDHDRRMEHVMGEKEFKKRNPKKW